MKTFFTCGIIEIFAKSIEKAFERLQVRVNYRINNGKKRAWAQASVISYYALVLYTSKADTSDQKQTGSAHSAYKSLRLKNTSTYMLSASKSNKVYHRQHSDYYNNMNNFLNNPQTHKWPLQEADATKMDLFVTSNAD